MLPSQNAQRSANADSRIALTASGGRRACFSTSERTRSNSMDAVCPPRHLVRVGVRVRVRVRVRARARARVRVRGRGRVRVRVRVRVRRSGRAPRSSTRRRGGT